jgi:hypothetical protein
MSRFTIKGGTLDPLVHSLNKDEATSYLGINLDNPLN